MSQRPGSGKLGPHGRIEKTTPDGDTEGGTTMFEVTARLKIRDGELDGFKQQAAEMMRLTREKDTKTLRYDWFLSDDGTECEVREGYVDADGLIEHAQNVAEAREKLFRDYAYGHEMTLYGEPSPALAELIERLAGRRHVQPVLLVAGTGRRHRGSSTRSPHRAAGDESGRGGTGEREPRLSQQAADERGRPPAGRPGRRSLPAPRDGPGAASRRS